MPSIPDQFFENKFPTEQDEDKMLKHIKKLARSSLNKSILKALEEAHVKYVEIKKINEEIATIGRQLDLSSGNILRDPILLHKRIRCWEKRYQLLKQLADIDYSLDHS